MSTIPGSLVANQRGVPTVRQLIILFDAGAVPDVHIDTTRLLAHTPDWQAQRNSVQPDPPIVAEPVNTR